MSYVKKDLLIFDTYIFFYYHGVDNESRNHGQMAACSRNSPLLAISKETIYRWLDSKKIPAHKIGKQWKFKTHEVDQWILAGEAEDKQ